MLGITPTPVGVNGSGPMSLMLVPCPCAVKYFPPPPNETVELSSNVCFLAALNPRAQLCFGDLPRLELVTVFLHVYF